MSTKYNFFLSNRHTCPSIILIIRWQSSNTGSEARGVIGSVLKITFAAVSYPLIHSVSVYVPSFSSYSSVRSRSQSADLLPSNSKPSYYRHCLATLYLGLRSSARHRSIIGLVTMNCATVFFQPRRRYPNPVIPPLSYLPPLGDSPIKRPVLSEVVSLPSCGPPCGGILSKPSQ